MAQSGGLCQRCGRNPARSVHHATYRRLGRELPQDLVPLCKPCHVATHIAMSGQLAIPGVRC